MITVGKLKLSLLILAVGAASFAAGFAFHSPADPVGRGNSSQDESTRAALRQQLNDANARANRVDVTEVQTEVRVIQPVGVITDPQDIIDTLIAIEKKGDPTNLRRVIIHHFQSLRAQGDAALKPIEIFLKRNEDRDYFMEPGTWRKDFYNLTAITVWVKPVYPEPTLCPRTLRLGLIDLLSQFEGGQAETILADTIKTTASGAELVRAAHHLEAMAPGKYTKMALDQAATLLMNLPHIAEPSRFDDLSRNFLVGYLLKHKDQTYLNHAREHLFDANDRLDTLHLNYIHAMQREASIPVLREIYKNYDLNREDQGVARDLAIRQYVGLDDDVTREFLTHIQACCNVYARKEEGDLVRMRCSNKISYLIDMIAKPPMDRDWDEHTLYQRAKVGAHVIRRLKDPHFKERMEKRREEIIIKYIKLKKTNEMLKALKKQQSGKQ